MRLGIEGAHVLTPRIHRDGRGAFFEWFHGLRLAEEIGGTAAVAQVNFSVSRRGVVRGIHFTAVPPGQAKFVSCFRGAIMDVVVDVRVGSPTFGAWEAVTLDDRAYRAVYLSEGLGHGFMALTDDAAVAYTCSQPYDPARERGLDPLDDAIGIAWPSDIRPVLSPNDTGAMKLADARGAGLLPSYDECAAPGPLRVGLPEKGAAGGR